ncbi:MAG: OmpA family protein [Verrucomicrobiota bacterium]|jgi:peptidoglycan-associated lipoprotein
MKTSSLVSILFVGAALTLVSAGCAHRPVSTTPIPEANRTAPSPPTNPGPGAGGTVETPNPIITTPGQPIPFDTTNNPWGDTIKNGAEDAATLKADTVYFDFDSSTIKKTEDKKLEEVAAYLKGHMADALKVEGNCDERGTEKYNLSLGERRALAVREYLANLGVDPRQVTTVSNGKAKPAAEGHNEAAWSKNRRADFVLLIPKS